MKNYCSIEKRCEDEKIRIYVHDYDLDDTFWFQVLVNSYNEEVAVTVIPQVGDVQTIRCGRTCEDYCLEYGFEFTNKLVYRTVKINVLVDPKILTVQWEQV